LNILESAVDSKVIIATATITKLNVDASAAVEGKGLIINANVTADGVTIEQNPTFLNIAEGVTAIIAGQPTTSDMPAPIIPSVPTGVPASFEAVNRFGIHEDKVYAGYSLKDKAGEQIALVASNIESMTVKNPDGTTATLTVGDDTDPLLWLNVEKAPGNYIFTVVTKAGVTYQATLTWTAPKVATWEATEREGEAPHDGKTYAEYKLMDGEDQISLKEGEVELIASKDANGKWVKLIPDTDATLWFAKAHETGNYEFIVVTEENIIYKATLDWKAPWEAVTEAEFEVINSFGIHEDKIYAGYSLKDEAGEQIALVASNIESMTVKNPDGTTATLTVGDDTDPLLWFNVEKAPGNYIYTVVICTKENETEEWKAYEATIEWTAPKVATWEATGGEGPHEGKTYVEYKLMDGENQVSLKEDEVKLIANKDADGKWVALEPNTDETLWFNKAKGTGDYEFFVATSEGAMYKAILNWEQPDMEAPELGEVTLTNDQYGNLVLTVSATDNGELASLEVDHSLDGKGVPEFTVGTEPVTDQTTGASAKFAGGTWTLNFGEKMSDLVREKATDGKITFYFVIKDVAGNQFGDMYNVTPEMKRTLDIPKAVTEDPEPDQG